MIIVIHIFTYIYIIKFGAIQTARAFCSRETCDVENVQSTSSSSIKGCKKSIIIADCNVFGIICLTFAFFPFNVVVSVILEVGSAFAYLSYMLSWILK